MLKLFLTALATSCALYFVLYYVLFNVSDSTMPKIMKIEVPCSIRDRSRDCFREHRKCSNKILSTFSSNNRRGRALNHKKSQDQKSNQLIFREKTSNFTIVALSKNSWCFNQDIIQYSATSTLHPSSTGELFIETLLYFTDKKSLYHLSQTAKCVVVVNRKKVFILDKLEVILMDTYLVNHELFKVTCVLSKQQHMGLYDDIFIGIVEQRRPVSEITSGLFYVNKPSFFDLSKNRIPGIVNCVHTVRGLNKDFYHQIRDWLRINQEIGLSQVKLCTVDHNSTFVTDLRNEFSDFIEINEFELNLKAICLNYDPLNLPKICRNSTALNWYFKGVNNFHEKVCTNECLLNYRYVYEYLSNYDVDELIFPRNFETNYHSEVLTKQNENSCTRVYKKHDKLADSQCLKYDMYNYVSRLQQIYGPQSAFLVFEHHMMLTQYEDLMFKIENTTFDLSSHKNTLQYDNKVDTRVKFAIPAAKFKYFNTLKNLVNLTRCLNQTYLAKSGLNYKWTNLITAPFKNRLGKSVFNCNLTLSINQHGGNLVVPGAYKANVDARFGFVGHFRTTDTSRQASAEPIASLKFDIEYLFFLIKSFQKV